MTIERFFYEGFRDEQQYAELMASPAFPLVRELEFKHGLKVLRKSPTRTADFTDVNDAWLMVNKFGIAVGKAYAHAEEEGKLTYSFRTPFFRKNRGTNSTDKETISSVKLSALMSTIGRNDVIKTAEMMAKKKLDVLPSLMAQHRSALGKSDKPTHPWSANEIHALLVKALGVTTDSSWAYVEENKCKEMLDKYEEADRVARVKQEQGKRMFSNPFFFVGIDEFGEYLIGKFRVTAFKEGDRVETETIAPLKRYRSLEDIPEILPVITMTKMAYEQKDVRKCHGFPVMDGYDENLDAVFYFTTTPTQYDHSYMVTPC